MSAEIRMGSDTPRNPDAIERQNDELRADMGRTIEALEQKLSPGQLLDRALGMVKEHGGEWAANLGNTTKHNPVPSILTAVGIAWLMASSNRTSSGYVEETDGGTPRSARWKERFNQAGERADALRSRAADSAHQLGERASSARARLEDKADSVRDSMHRARERSRDAGAKLQATFEDQPLVMGAVGVALGAILGSMLPGTQREDRLMGDARDRVLDKARIEGERQYEHAREKVDQAVDRSRDGAEEQRHH